jgi:hypothetical protein
MKPIIEMNEMEAEFEAERVAEHWKPGIRRESRIIACNERIEQIRQERDAKWRDRLQGASK